VTLNTAFVEKIVCKVQDGLTGCSVHEGDKIPDDIGPANFGTYN